MIDALLETIVFIGTIASMSLLCGILRTAKASSQLTEEQSLAPLDAEAPGEQGTAQEPSPSLPPFRNAS
jgi:hypothetical protein